MRDHYLRLMFVYLAGCNQGCTQSKSIWMVKGECSVWSRCVCVLGGPVKCCYCILYILMLMCELLYTRLSPVKLTTNLWLGGTLIVFVISIFAPFITYVRRPQIL